MKNNWSPAAKLSVTMALAFLVCVGTVVVQVLVSGDLDNLFLVWNLILAVIPLVLALGAGVWADRRTERPGWWTLGIVSFLWLLFFPNATYIVTDLFHIVERNSPKMAWGSVYHEKEFWADVLIWAFFAFTGHLAGLVSLGEMHRLWAKRAGRIAGWFLVGGASFAAGFGIFLGRFARLNSWHVLTHPDWALGYIGFMLRSAFGQMFAFAFGFGLFILLGYLILHSWAGRHRESHVPLAPFST